MDGNKVRSNDCHGMAHDGHCEGVVDRSVDEPKAVPFSRGECYFGVVSSGSTVGVDVGPVEQDVVTRGGRTGLPGDKRTVGIEYAVQQAICRVVVPIRDGENAKVNVVVARRWAVDVDWPYQAIRVLARNVRVIPGSHLECNELELGKCVWRRLLADAPRGPVLSGLKRVCLAVAGRDWAFRYTSDPIIDIVVQLSEAMPMKRGTTSVVSCRLTLVLVLGILPVRQKIVAHGDVNSISPVCATSY